MPTSAFSSRLCMAGWPKLTEGVLELVRADVPDHACTLAVWTQDREAAVRAAHLDERLQLVADALHCVLAVDAQHVHVAVRLPQS